MSPSKILFFLCISFVLGIFLESVVNPSTSSGRGIPQILLCVFLLLGIIAVFISITLSFSRRRESSKKEPRFPIKLGMTGVLGFCLLFLSMGVLRMQVSEFNIANDKFEKINGKGQVVLTGIICDEPDIRDTSQKIKVEVGNSIILVTTKRYPEYKYLDEIKITGKLETPKATDSFDYKKYLLKDHIYSVMNFPKIELIFQKHQYNFSSFIYGKVLFLKQKLNQSIQDNSLPPHSLILEGIILGNNKNMTQDLRDKLNNTGLRFLTAISGVHVVILSAILISFLIYLGLGRISAFYSSIFLIWLYVALTGFTASGIRAATMGSIFIFAGALGRQNTSSRTIVLAGAIMLMQNPLLLTYDIGFQLSFMACLGIIYLKPAISYLLKNIFKDKFRELSDIVAVTITAQIFTLPLMIYNFGVIPLVSPITNILILPVMPFILGFGFVFSIIGAFSKILGFILYIPCWVLISYFLKVMDFFSQPWMAKSVTNVSWIWVLVSYIIIFYITWFLNKKYSQKIV